MGRRARRLLSADCCCLGNSSSLLRLTRSPSWLHSQVMSRLFLVHCDPSVSRGTGPLVLYLMVTSWALVDPKVLLLRVLFLESKIFRVHCLHFGAHSSWCSTRQALLVKCSRCSLEPLLSNGTAHGFHFDVPAMLAAVGLGSAQANGSASPAVVSAAFSYRLVSFTWISYLAGGPHVDEHVQHAEANQTGRALKQAPSCGVEWPVTDKKTGARSTLKTNKEIWTQAFIGITEAGYEVQERGKLIGKLRNCKNWRRDYHKWVNKSVQISCESAGDCLAVAKAGLGQPGACSHMSTREQKRHES